MHGHDWVRSLYPPDWAVRGTRCKQCRDHGDYRTDKNTFAHSIEEDDARGAIALSILCAVVLNARWAPDTQVPNGMPSVAAFLNLAEPSSAMSVSPPVPFVYLCAL